MCTGLLIMMEKTKKIILFDIDHTIFNTELYRENLYTKLAIELGHDVNKFKITAKNIYQNLRKSSPFLPPDLFLKTLLSHAERNTDLKKIESIFWEKTLYENCIYPDVRKTLAYLTENEITIGIFSTGDLEHQKIKVESLKEYLVDNHIYISPDKLKVIKDTFDVYKNYQTYLIDDFPEILMRAKSHNRAIFTVFIKREVSYERLVIPKDFKPDATITNLDQLIDIIKTDN